MSSKIRLDILLSSKGFGARKKIKTFLINNKITVENQRILSPDFSLDPNKTKIFLNEEPLSFPRRIYLMMNKKKGVVCAKKDKEKRTVFDDLGDCSGDFDPAELNVAGRLDIDTEGLVLLTSDGKLLHKIISGEECFKKYFVGLKKGESVERQEEIKFSFFQGIFLPHCGREPGFTTKPGHLTWLDKDKAELEISEGKFHHVKRMFKAIGNEVVYLKRIKIHNLDLDPKLGPGEFRELSEEEIVKILE